MDKERKQSGGGVGEEGKKQSEVLGQSEMKRRRTGESQKRKLRGSVKIKEASTTGKEGSSGNLLLLQKQKKKTNFWVASVGQVSGSL